MKKVTLIFILFFVAFLVFEIYIRYFSNYNEPYFDNINKIIKRRKNTEGRYKTKDTKTGYFRINNEGWNSCRDFFEKKEHDKCRIAIVGHSNVEGLRVRVDKIFSNILEKKLLENNKNVETYTFGFGGMHLAQALHVSRYGLGKYHPDVLVIGTLLEDFFYNYDSPKYFLSLKISPDSKIEEILPVNANQNNSPLSFLYFSKVIKYIDIKLGIGNILSNISKKQINNAQEKKYFLQLRDSICRQNSILAVDYLLQEFLQLQKKYKNKLFFIEFPFQLPSYNEQPLQSMNYLNLHNKEIIERIKNYSFSVISLDSDFIQDFQKNGRKFDFPNDRHYNEYAHELIGKSLSNYFINNNIINTRH